MGGAICRAACRRQSEQGDALDTALTGERKPWAERTVAEFIRGPEASLSDRLNVRLMDWIATRRFKLPNPADRVIPFSIEPSPIVPGLQLLTPADSPQGCAEAMRTIAEGKKVIVASVRMGYGHHRIAYSALTWAIQLGVEPYLLDILAPDCVESDIVKNMDKQYSRMSRIASQFGGVIDTLWGNMMLKGDINMLRFFVALADKVYPIIASLPRDVPIITSYPLIGQMAVRAGFKKVINLVFDNFPQYFVLVPGALNLVQSPSYFDKLLDMGCPATNLQLGGHWVSSDICLNVRADSEARIARCQNTELPRRFLIAVGGAGAQKAFIQDLLEGMADLLRAERIRIFLNCGDHVHIADAVLSKLRKLGLEWDEVTTSEGTEEFCRQQPLAAVAEPPAWKAVTILRFSSHFAAFRCTDLVCRICDVLVTKPSELAFFPVPKLHIRRVGAHEAFSALRSTELGDGTVECRTVEHTMKKVAQLIEDRSPLFLQMNRSILKAQSTFTYEGSRVAVEHALGSRV